jgi:hypothetical protein
MNCETVRANVIFYVYDDLADDLRFEMVQHLERCAACKREWETARDFRDELAALPAPEPTQNLLAASRMRLHDALETAPQHGAWRWAFDPAAWLRQMKFSPALAAIILIIGFAAGILTAFDLSRNASLLAQTAVPTETSIAGIRGITMEPGSKTVRVKYDQLLPESAQGSIDDPRIQQLLLYAAQNQQNSGVRVESIDLLAQKAGDPRVRQALMFALRYDRNPGVRLCALDGLQAYVAQDVQVRNAIVEALLNDANQGVRTEAIHLLQPVKADSSVRSAFEQLADNEDNEYLRSEAQRTLDSLPPID